MSDFNPQAKGLFGRYCKIEMFRYGVPNEFYLHKIVSQSRRNTYCDVPLRWDSKPVKHPAKEGVSFPDNLEEVIWVVQCGIDETHVFPVALKDVEVLGEDFNTGCEFQEIDSDGYPFCASASEIVRLRDDLNLMIKHERKLSAELMVSEQGNRDLELENERLQRELAIRQESKQEKVIEYMRQENADWEDRYRALIAENDKLRKLCERFAEYVSQDRCEGCVSKRRCNEGDIDECWQRTEIRDMAHEVGIEVDE